MIYIYNLFFFILFNNSSIFNYFSKFFALLNSTDDLFGYKSIITLSISKAFRVAIICSIVWIFKIFNRVCSSSYKTHSLYIFSIIIGFSSKSILQKIILVFSDSILNVNVVLFPVWRLIPL